MGEQIKHPIDYSDLEQRVFAFNRLELPGQPQAMHLGTRHLVNDLWHEVRESRAEVTEPHLEYATRLAVVLWEKHWKEDAPEWRPLPDLLGVLTQIDNMTVGLIRAR